MLLLLLNFIVGWKTFAESNLRENITNFICLFIEVRVKLDFPLIGPLASFSNLAFSSLTDLFILWTLKKKLCKNDKTRKNHDKDRNFIMKNNRR